MGFFVDDNDIARRGHHCPLALNDGFLAPKLACRVSDSNIGMSTTQILPLELCRRGVIEQKIARCLSDASAAIEPSVHPKLSRQETP